MRFETIADLEQERDRLRAEEQATFAYLHQDPRPADWSLVLDSYEAIRRLLAPLESALVVWKPIAENEAERSPLLEAGEQVRYGEAMTAVSV